MSPELISMFVMALFSVLAANVYSKNFLLTYAIVRASNDNKVMLQLLGKRGFYFKAGKMNEDTVSYRVDRKNKNTLKIKNAKFFRGLGVNWIILEEGTDRSVNAITDAVFTGTPGADPAAYDDLLERALKKPALNANQEKMILLLLLGIAAVCLFIAFQINTLQDAAQVGSTVITGGDV